MTKNEIMTTLKGDYNAFSERGFEVFGVFFFGSFNYGLDRELSDVDAKLIYINKPDDLENNTIYIREDSFGQVNVMSIEDFLTELSNGYHVWYEILFTNYCVVNLRYRSLWNEIVKLRKDLVKQTLKRRTEAEINYVREEVLKAFMSEDSLEHKNKRLTHVLRLADLIKRLLNGENYPEVLQLEEGFRQRLLNIKINTPLNEEDCLKEIALSCKSTHEFLEERLKMGFPNESTEALDKISQLMLSIREGKDDTQL